MRLIDCDALMDRLTERWYAENEVSVRAVFEEIIKQPTTKESTFVKYLKEIIFELQEANTNLIQTIGDCNVVRIDKAEWIPCDERLPEEDGRSVLVYTDQETYDVGVMLHGFGIFIEGYGKPIAWMPLPQPYEFDAPDINVGM